MALITYQQTDTAATFNVACSGGSAGATTDARQASPGGTAGATEQTIDPNNDTTAVCFAFDCSAPGASASWDSGTWTVNINHTTMDVATILTEVRVCDFDGSSTYVDVDSGGGGTVNSSPGHTRGATGSLAVNVTQNNGHTPQSAANSRPFIVLTYNNNDAHGNSSGGITPSLTIASPIDDGAAAGGSGALLAGARNRLVIA